MVLLGIRILYSQIAVNTDGSAPDASAGLDVNYTNKGFLMPRMTKAQIMAISSPANGLQVFCTTDNKIYIFIGTANQWKEVAYGTAIITPCGSSITINHVAGSVAPVTKTVTYATVNNIPGETSKCWITSNLGADRQATAVDDNTEASAGWYWQFNRKQGYQHDGTTLIPSWNSTIIIENSDWIAANDPCNLEIGNGWRLPTYTEWNNVNTTGGWADWNGPWNSALKMHAGGFLETSTGSLGQRGGYGCFWSNMQNSSTFGWHLGFYNLVIWISGDNKSYGFSSRCIRD